ncbi:ferric reductase-like transmembrane domain-containing protein [Streptomyces sp. VRA16 Mangrove soil]|uniref:ferredoxin reductase family protein n=1 Tax=Streptomyces sp. VRA16 Mangrove soil TaxID=2817434 RepID=UPI001A9EBF5F|nr:ferredoxin reductase family protein [Streptomyces sp. VRA16 Mangrove soil]MBO1331702.1 ferredoxin reductase family protein [Streptomyces sp. VRA16 Mangrove soil]
MVTATHSPPPTRHRAPAAEHRRSPAVPLLAAAWAGGLAVLGLWWQDTTSVVGAAGWLNGAGRITGLLCGYMCALLVVLMARVPWLERGVGSDRAVRWHASAGRWTVGLLLAHIVLITLGYAAQAHVDVVSEFFSIVLDLPEMLKGTLGAAILVLVGFVSARAVRRRMRYETWYYLHLLTYAAIFLAFWHQLALGADFVGNQAAQFAWYVLYVGAAALVLWFRVLVPVRSNLRHRLRVEAVVPEGPGVHSVWVRGRHLDELGARPGQFFRWRFLTQGLWNASHPYSLSAVPQPDLLRITVKSLGDHSAAVPTITRGTRVWAEGPYGALTADRRRRRKVLLLAGGTGITPLRTLFETLPAAPGDLTLLYRARTTEELTLRHELEAIADRRGARLLYALNGPDGARTPITADRLRATLPDIAQHDVYLCGPHPLSVAAYDALREAGVPASRIHYESFEF